MFREQQIKKVKRLLGLKNDDSVILFGSRLSGWIKQNGTTTTSILRGISVILEDLHKKEIKKAKKEVKINLNDVKNPVIYKYAKEILKLHKEDKMGARKIEKWLKEMHNVKVSYGTIYKFLKFQKEVENG